MIDLAEIGAHVKDAPDFHVPVFIWRHLPEWMQGHKEGLIALPNFGTVELFGQPVELQVTKFMVLEVVAAVLPGVSVPGAGLAVASGICSR
jgi:hypothetical protein